MRGFRQHQLDRLLHHGQVLKCSPRSSRTKPPCHHRRRQDKTFSAAPDGHTVGRL